MACALNDLAALGEVSEPVHDTEDPFIVGDFQCWTGACCRARWTNSTSCTGRV